MAFEFLKANRMGGNIVLVVGALLQPDIGDRLSESSVRPWSGSDPFICHGHCGAVVIGIDKNLLLSQFLQPDTPDRRFLPTVNPSGRIRIIAPMDDQLTVF